MANATPRWIKDDEAQALLAHLAAHPPQLHTFRYAFNETDTRFIGKDVRALNRIRERYLEQAAHYDQLTGEQTFAEEIAVTVTQAIREAIAARKAAEMLRDNPPVGRLAREALERMGRVAA